LRPFKLGIDLPKLLHWLGQGFQSWHDLKTFFERSTAINHDTLHLLAGTLIWLCCAIILRRSLKSWLPLIVVLVIIMINESVDLWVEIWPEKARQFGEGAKDLLMTMSVPAALFVVLRLFPWLGSGRQR
jgi:diacylglycerol kinase